MLFRFPGREPPIFRKLAGKDGALRVPYVQNGGVKVATGKMQRGMKLLGLWQAHVHLKLKPISAARDQRQALRSRARRNRNLGTADRVLEQRKSRCAASSVTGDFSLAAIGVEQTGSEAILRRPHEHPSIAADARSTGANPAGCLGQIGRWSLARPGQKKIVLGSVQFSKWDFHSDSPRRKICRTGSSFVLICIAGRSE